MGRVGLRYPQLFGNGKGVAHHAFLDTTGGVWLLLALAALKPLAAAGCRASGASGGLLTQPCPPAPCSGDCSAPYGPWPGPGFRSYALFGAAAMQAPLTGLALILELTHTGMALLVPAGIAVVAATVTARYLDGYSIYSARLPAGPWSADSKIR